MKKIILFIGGVETLDYFSLQLADAFVEMGHEVFVFDLQEEIDNYVSLLWFCEKDNTVMISFNFTAMQGDDIFLEKDVLFWDKHNIPCINIVVDHPFYYHKLIQRVPRLYHQICIDRYHEQYMRHFFPAIKLEPFLPLGGTAVNPTHPYTMLKDRPIDIIFTGNYTPPHTFDKHITRIDEEYTAFYHSIIDALIADTNLGMEEVFETYLRKEIEDISEEDLKSCMEKMIFIDLYIRFYFRGLVVKTIVDSGLKVHVFGKGWDYLECEHPENIIDGDGIDSYTCLEKISQAKISLNVMPWFKDGAHDRIFNSMLNGALCLSDSSIYLNQEFIDGENIKFYSLTAIDQLPEMIQSLLDNPEKMQKIADAGYKKAKQEHTWASRAEALEMIIKKI